LLYVKKIGTKLNKNNIGTKMNIKHWLWHMIRYWVDIWRFRKNKS